MPSRQTSMGCTGAMAALPLLCGVSDCSWHLKLCTHWMTLLTSSNCASRRLGHGCNLAWTLLAFQHAMLTANACAGNWTPPGTSSACRRSSRNSRQPAAAIRQLPCSSRCPCGSGGPSTCGSEPQRSAPSEPRLVNLSMSALSTARCQMMSGRQPSPAAGLGPHQAPQFT